MIIGRLKSATPGGIVQRARSVAGGMIKSAEAFSALAFQQAPLLINGLFASIVIGAAGFGRIASAQAFLNIFIAVGSISSSVVSYRIALLHRDDPAHVRAMVRFLRTACIASSLGVAGMLALYSQAASAGGGLKSAALPEIGMAIAFVAASVICSYQQGLVLAEGKARQLLAINFGTFVVVEPIALFLIREVGYEGYFLASFLIVAVRAILVEAIILRSYGGGRASDFPWRRTLATFMLPATLASFTALPAFWIASELLYKLPRGQFIFGLISVAISIKQAPLLLFNAINSVEGRRIYLAYSTDRRSAYRHLARLAVGLATAALVMGATALGVMMFYETFFGVLPDADIKRKILLLVTLLLTCEVLNAITYIPINIVGRMWHSLLLISIPRDIIFIACAYFAIAVWGWPGFLIALICEYLIGCCLNLLVYSLGNWTKPSAQASGMQDG